MAPVTRSNKDVKRQLSVPPKTICKKNHKTSNRTTDKIQNDVNINYIQCETQPENVSIPSNAEPPEHIVFKNEILANIYTNESDGLQYNVTNFSIYDENKHMFPIDSGLIERNIALYLTGYVIYDNGSGIEKEIAVRELGPIKKWWFLPHDDGYQIIIGICTNYGNYVLMEPHSSYKKYMTSVTEKTHLSIQVIKCLLNNDYYDNHYKNILNSIKISVNPATGKTFNEEDLIAHAQFVIDQVAGYDVFDDNYLPLTETQCIETLIELSGAVNPAISKRSERIREKTKVNAAGISKQEFSKAIATKLVKDVFENMFAAQLDVDDKCYESMNKQVNTVFDNVCNEEATKINNVDIDNNRVMWKNQKLHVKMFVHVQYDTSVLVGQIEYFFKKSQYDMAHLKLFIHSYETVLEETSDPKEIFALKKCMNINIQDVITILDVTHKQPTNNWSNIWGSKLQEPVNRDNANSFFYQLEYDVEFGRFEYPKFEDPSDVKKDKYCNNCQINTFKNISKTPIPIIFIEKENHISYYEKFKLYNEVFNIGSFVYLQPDIFSTSTRANFVNDKPYVHKNIKKKNNQILKKADETKYPEYYRKTLGNSVRGSNESTPNPFEIGEILAVYTHEMEPTFMKLLVRRMYRAEHVPVKDYDNNNTDMNMLFWSEEEFIVPADNICGKCFVAFIDNIVSSPIVWSAGGADRFYFTAKYDFLTGSIILKSKLPYEAQLTGKEVFINYNCTYVNKHKLQNIPSYKKIKPLRGLDIFSGCGGLSKGLEDSGLVKTEWAIEHDEEAAASFELNNPNSTVFVEDCNHLLKLLMSGHKTNLKGQVIPQKGEVDFICGGPPCQGFSGMNRFSSGEYSQFKNSLIVSFLSYIDYYRPKYFVMENVKSFASFKKGIILKLTLRCLTLMGYQCTFGVLQAGNFGVPQTRRRLVILGAAPGEPLPFYPEPIHVFNRKGSSLNIQIGGKQFRTNCQYGNSAPMRTVTIYDAWSDLPRIKHGADSEILNYNSQPITHLQRLLRYSNNDNLDCELIDHICKDMSALMLARMELIPKGRGKDWRDLPNEQLMLVDGTTTEILKYSKDKSCVLRKVCQCASGRKCVRQKNTIIPWFLSHTGNKNNNWVGLYGRLEWTGYCSTTITNPEPNGKQGRVLHPEQNRVISVRECARSQGFNDSFLFSGSIMNKYRQIGNAVPPPMGVAIGHEIIKAIEKKIKQ